MTSTEVPDLPPSAGFGAVATTITEIDDDLLHIILSRIPAKSFALASCVSRTWNNICSRILSRPKLSSAFSLNPILPNAIREVVSKVLSDPIRPDFAILCCFGNSFRLRDAHRLIAGDLGSRTPIITCEPHGIIGRNAVTDEFNEVMHDVDEEAGELTSGVSLTVGYVPGLKVEVVPLVDSGQGSMDDKFVMDIMEFSAAASGSTSPDAIIMFGEHQHDMKPLLDKMNYAMSGQVIIVGNESCHFMCTRTIGSRNISPTTGAKSSCDAAALVFAKDKSFSAGMGSIQFHLSLACGITAVGPTYKAVSVKMRPREYSSWLNAKRDGHDEILDGHQILADVDNEMGDGISNPDLYVGVAERRKCSLGSEKVQIVSSLAYHPVLDGDDEYLYVRGINIKTGDRFRFYVPDKSFALTSRDNASRYFRRLTQSWITESCHQGHSVASWDCSVFGAFIFTCCGRGEEFFERPNVDSSPILDNFPNITVAGMFCGGEIGVGPTVSFFSQETEERNTIQSPLHVYSSVYLLLSYHPDSSVV